MKLKLNKFPSRHWLEVGYYGALSVFLLCTTLLVAVPGFMAFPLNPSTLTQNDYHLLATQILTGSLAIYAIGFTLGRTLFNTSGERIKALEKQVAELNLMVKEVREQ